MISAPACSTFGVQQVQVGAVRGLLQLGIRVLGEAVPTASIHLEKSVS